jgi:hypothetical protein
MDILLLAASMNSMVRHDDVGTSLKSTVTEFAHPALLARRLAAFRDHFFDVFHKVPDLVFLPPACRLRGASGARRHLPDTPNYFKKKSRTSIRVSQVLPGAGRWPLPD